MIIIHHKCHRLCIWEPFVHIIFVYSVHYVDVQKYLPLDLLTYLKLKIYLAWNICMLLKVFFFYNLWYIVCCFIARYCSVYIKWHSSHCKYVSPKNLSILEIRSKSSHITHSRSLIYLTTIVHTLTDVLSSLFSPGFHYIFTIQNYYEVHKDNNDSVPKAQIAIK